MNPVFVIFDQHAEHFEKPSFLLGHLGLRDCHQLRRLQKPPVFFFVVDDAGQCFITCHIVRCTQANSYIRCLQ